MTTTVYEKGEYADLRIALTHDGCASTGIDVLVSIKVWEPFSPAQIEVYNETYKVKVTRLELLEMYSVKVVIRCTRRKYLSAEVFTKPTREFRIFDECQISLLSMVLKMYVSD